MTSTEPLTRFQAFQSPLLDDCNSNSSGRDLAKSSIGETRIRYGAARDPRFGESRSTRQMSCIHR